MRKFIIALALFGFLACQQKAFEDKRPADQIRFVNFVKELKDNVNAAENNKTLRNALLENGIPALKTYVRDSLNLRFSAWQVRVLDKTEDYPNPGSVQLKLGIAFNPEDISENSRYQSIVLSCILNQADAAAMAVLKQLKTGDQVKINGEFIEKKEFIDIDSYSRYKYSKNVFDNPEFKSKLTAIEIL